MTQTILASLATASLGGTLLFAPEVASAEQPDESQQDTTAVMGPEQDYQEGLMVNGVAPTLRSVIVDDETILAYCIELAIQAADPDHTSAVTGWDEFTGDNKFKTDQQVRQYVAWILRHSYPTLGLDELATSAGIGDLSQAEAVAATQAAIWHFTDDFVADGDLDVDSALSSNTAVSAESAQRVQAVFDYLTGDENIGLNEQEVQASVTLVDGSGAEATRPEPLSELIDDEDDHVIGPVELNASTTDVDLDIRAADDHTELEQLTVLDATGEPIDTTEPVATEQLWLHVPADTETGGVQIVAESQEYGYTGRLITPEPDEQRRFQTIVVVDQASDSAASELELNWEQPQSEAPPEPDEPLVPEDPPEPDEPPVPEDPPVEDPPIEEPPEEESAAELTAPQPEEKPEPAEAPEAPAPPVEDNPESKENSESEETEKDKAAGELAETGPHQTRNILVALGTLAAGAALLVINGYRRRRS